MEVRPAAGRQHGLQAYAAGKGQNMRNLHLICNAHIDPVWLWDMEEGISAAISTFRMAARFCEEYDGMVFNHNEVVLYEWIEEQEPELFVRIQKLVKEGKWHIMGGWYLQPDCNMPSGESMIRQMEQGRSYFQEKFGMAPATAINFDPFGHSRGLVQLMAKAGFDSYLFGRPGQGDCPLPDDDFIWVGFDGSKVMAHRSNGYNTPMGKAAEKIQEWKENYGQRKDLPVGCFLWGVGNHGGGPSRRDLDAIGQLMQAEEAGGTDGAAAGADWKLLHSTPEAYFAEREKLCREQGRKEPEVERDLNAWAVGCYTSQSRIKQKHRALEGELSMTEKMLSQAAVRGLLTYPMEELTRAQKALLFCEFHDILPGSSIQPVEERGIQTLDYGLEIVGKWKRRAFFALMKGEAAAAEGEYPILVYNPHPYEIEGDFTCEFQLADQNWSDSYALPVITCEGKEIPSQVEKEGCNMNLDWRKKVTFHSTLKPSSMNRFSARIKMVEKREAKSALPYTLTRSEEQICFTNDQMTVVINCRTGLLDAYRVGDVDYLKPGACALAVMKSDCDPWGMNRHSYREEEGRFTLMNEEEGSWYSGTSNERHAGQGVLIPSVRIIEQGAVRTIVEAVFSYENAPDHAPGHSQACVQYVLSAQSSAIELKLRINWSEKGKLLKLELPSCLEQGVPLSETVYGVMEQKADGEEKVFQRWCGLWEGQKALTVVNSGNYGADFLDGVMRISLLHSAVYSAHPIGDRPLLVQDRFLPYMDQGEREFSFLIQGGEGVARREQITREAMSYQEKPMAVQAFPTGEGQKPDSAVLLDSTGVELTAFRKLSGQEAYLIRLYESAGKASAVGIRLPELGIEKEVPVSSCEVKTLKLDPAARTLKECGIFGE